MAIAAALVGKGASTSNTVTTAAGTSAASGSTFVIAITFDSTVSITSVVDSKLNPYTIVGTVQPDPDNMASTVLYCCQPSDGGFVGGGALHTATVVFSGTAFPTVELIEITGAASASVDKAAQGTDSASPFTLTSPTLSQAAELVLCMANCNFNSNGTNTYSSSNFSIIGQEADASQFWTSAVGVLVVASTAAVTPSFTCLQGQKGALALVTFKEAGGGGGTLSPAAVSAPGVGAANFTTQSAVSAALSAAGIATVNFGATSVVGAALSAPGAAAANFSTQSTQSAALSAPGAGGANFAASSSSAASPADLSAAGVATVNFGAASVVGAAVSAPGIGAATFRAPTTVINRIIALGARRWRVQLEKPAFGELSAAQIAADDEQVFANIAQLLPQIIHQEKYHAVHRR